jgi:hypothetical protein
MNILQKSLCFATGIAFTVLLSAKELQENTTIENKLQDYVNDHIDFGFHAAFAAGDTSVPASNLATAHHDPSREDGTVQSLEGSISARWEKLHLFAVHNFNYNFENDWSNSWEEAFAKVLPTENFEIRGGRMLNRFGLQNNKHIHSWDFVDAPIATSQFLGEDGLRMNGVDLIWILPTRNTSGITFSYGKQLMHAHSHSHGEDADHEHAHEDEGEHEGEEHEEEHIENPGQFKDKFFSADFFYRHPFSDFHSLNYGVSFAFGDNYWDKNTYVGATSLEYLWRENGLEPGGKRLKLSGEILSRHIETNNMFEDNRIDSTLSQTGFYANAVYQPLDLMSVGLRIGHITDLSEIEIQDRTRISPALTFFPLRDDRVTVRLQYNHDDYNGKDEHAVWLQFGLNFTTGAEVR